MSVTTSTEVTSSRVTSARSTSAGSTSSSVTNSGVASSGVTNGAVPPPRRLRPGRATEPGAVAAPTSRAAVGLLRQAADGIVEAYREDDPLLRYPASYLAALRAAAAVLAVRARPQPRRGSGRNVWQLLAEVAPELAEWAGFFASCSGTRAAAEAGITRLVGRREADDLLRQAEQFVGVVASSVPLR